MNYVSQAAMKKKKLFLNKILAELKGIKRLAVFLLESLVNVKTNCYHCPFCNQTLYAFQKKCDRCDCLLGWA